MKFKAATSRHYHRISGACLMWMQALHLVSHRTRFLFSVTHPPLSELQLWSCGKELFDSSRPLEPPPQAVCKPRSCRCLLVTNGKAWGRRKAQMKAAGLEKWSISDLWIFFKQHLISYSTGEHRGTVLTVFQNASGGYLSYFIKLNWKILCVKSQNSTYFEI